MRLVIITPASLAHHLHFCSYLNARHDVVGVIRPAAGRRTLRTKLERTRSRLSRLGPTYGALRALGATRNPFVGWDWIGAFDAAEGRFFPNARADYEQAGIPQLSHTVDDVNGAETTSLVRELAPDVVLCLGGPIYRQPLIDACGTMMNFHSGVSPLYNGASTILNAFANGHVHLCGGTLMTMSAAVDGGDIVGHYLPAIDADDDPATLFMKTVRGAAEFSSRFLEHFEREGRFTKVPQTPPLFYCTSEDWTVCQTQRIRRHLGRGIAARYSRQEEMLSYWSLPSEREAGDSVKATIERLLHLA